MIYLFDEDKFLIVLYIGKIAERFFLQALDRFWHNSCLKCTYCGIMLAEVGSSCYARGGMILCKEDYSR